MLRTVPARVHRVLIVVLAGMICSGGASFAQHTADQNADLSISLGEALRVIQLFNAPAYHCDESGEDGYAPGSDDQSCAKHDSDYGPEDWRIDLSELLRLIQYFNVGAYHFDVTGEDGFAPGAPTEGVVSISEPENNYSVYANANNGADWYRQVTLTGLGYDPEDGALDGARLVWTTRIDGGAPEVLGTGTSISANLVGRVCGSTHEITLTATDSDANVLTTSINVFINVLCK